MKSQTAERKGIDNTPNEKVLAKMRIVGKKVFDKMREHFGVPVGVSSFYRSPKLNKAIGGAKNSQHVKGEAIDIDADMFGGVTNKQIFDYIRKNLDFDQLISEFGTEQNPAWIHVSYTTKNRKQILRAEKVNGKTVYKTIK